MKYIVTGGAGFIGSALVWGLNERGENDILIVDEVVHDEQEENVAPLDYEALISGDEFREKLARGEYDNEEVDAILHMGAISSTTERDWSKFEDVNIAFTQEVVRWCADRGVRCIYASSAATYGDGQKGYSDEHALFDELEPLNLYGKSKLQADIWARDGGYLDAAVGLRYFNVFGPNEWHKEHMRSVIAKKFDEVQSGEPIRLFKSNHPDYGDGEQMRDFIYVKNAVDATLHFLDNREAGGVFNVGTGQARTWNDVAYAMFAALDREPEIVYVDMPEELANQYQNYTQADISKLRAAGYRDEFTVLEHAIADYVQNHLIPHAHLGA